MSRRLIINLILMIVVLFGLFGLALQPAYAYWHAVTLPTPSGNADGVMYTWTSDADAMFTANGGNHYYIGVNGKVWGQCSPDMTGCTPNRWKVKGSANSSKNYSSGTDVVSMSSQIYGIGIARHQVQHTTSTSMITKYTTEHGTGTAQGASYACYTNGPALSANYLTGLPCP